MAQKTEKEETEFKVPETIPSPNAAAANICQNRFISSTSSPSSADTASPGVAADFASPRTFSTRSENKRDASTQGPPEAMVNKKVVNRCFGCRRKVGLTGFRCRCGELFCSEHRYSDRHKCSYDYKAAGREAIARENPVVKAAKIVRI